MDQTSRKFRRSIVESRFTPIVFATLAIAMRVWMFLSIGIQQQVYPTSFVWHIFAPVFKNGWISLTASTAAVFLIAYTISQLNLRFNLIRFRTALPFSLLVFLLSVHPLFLSMSPNYVSAIFILFALFPLLASYQHHSPRSFAFKSGVLIALAGVFQVYALLLLPLWWYGKISMHGFKVKSNIAFILAVLLVFWNVAGFYFIFDSLQSFLLPFFYFEKIDLNIPEFSLITWIIIALLILIPLIFLMLDFKIFRRERVLIQKTLSFIILIVTCSFILHLLYWRQTSTFVYSIIAMISFIISHYYSHIKTKRQVYSFILLFTGLFILYIHYII